MIAPARVKSPSLADGDVWSLMAGAGGEGQGVGESAVVVVVGKEGEEKNDLRRGKSLVFTKNLDTSILWII